MHFGKPPTWHSRNLSSFIFFGISRSFLPQLTVKKNLRSLDVAMDVANIFYGSKFKLSRFNRYWTETKSVRKKNQKNRKKKRLIWGKRALPKERWPMVCLRSEILFSLILVLTETLIFHKKTILSEYQANFFPKFKKKKFQINKLNLVLIQSNKILSVFLVFTSKIETIPRL